MDEKTLLERAIKSADSLILTAKKLDEGKYTPTKGNAITNAYRSAGQLYLSILQNSRDIESMNVTARAEVELTKADKARLEKVYKQLKKMQEG